MLYELLKLSLAGLLAILNVCLGQLADITH